MRELEAQCHDDVIAMQNGPETSAVFLVEIDTLCFKSMWNTRESKLQEEISESDNWRTFPLLCYRSGTLRLSHEWLKKKVKKNIPDWHTNPLWSPSEFLWHYPNVHMTIQKALVTQINPNKKNNWQKWVQDQNIKKKQPDTNIWRET